MYEHASPPLPQLVPESVVRERFGVSRSTLWRWRKTGTGPKCYQLGPRLMYDPADLTAWLESQRADAPRAA
jgi:predicted DNA-binding transcriptional regulator AlpA